MDRINIELRSRDGFKQIFEDFLDQVEMFVDESEESGMESIRNAFHSNKLTVDSIYSNIDRYGSDKAIVLFEVINLKGIDESELLDAIFKTSDLEKTSGLVNESWDENFICNVPARTEFKIDLNSIPGTLDGITYKNLYSKLKSKLDPDEVRKIEEYFPESTIQNGIMHIETPQYYWSLYVNPDKLLHEIAPKLRMTVDEIKDLEKSVAVGE